MRLISPALNLRAGYKVEVWTQKSVKLQNSIFRTECVFFKKKSVAYVEENIDQLYLLNSIQNVGFNLDHVRKLINSIQYNISAPPIKILQFGRSPLVEPGGLLAMVAA